MKFLKCSYHYNYLVAIAAVAAATVKMADPVVPVAVNKNMFVVAESSIGGRKEMENFIILKKEYNEEKIIERGFIAICNGHGGKETA